MKLANLYDSFGVGVPLNCLCSYLVNLDLDCPMGGTVVSEIELATGHCITF